jgi:hypothetical protein
MCLNIARPIPAPVQPETHDTTPLVHSGLLGARVGVASAVPTTR